MKKLVNKKMILAKSYIEGMLNSERGDTNFISILIILGIVIVVATVFLGFKDRIVEMVEGIVDNFTIQ